MYEITQANKFIDNMYLKFGQGLDRDDFRGNAWIAYMEVRKKDSDILAFAQYWIEVEKIIWEQIEQFRKNRNKVYATNSKLSLDQTYGEYNESIGAILFPTKGDFVNGIVFWDYVEQLNNKKVQIIRLITEKEDDYEIMERLHMSLSEYYQLKLEIKEDMLEYFEFI